MPDKGITPVVAVIMLLLIVIAVVGGTYTFIQRTMQTTQNQTSQQVQHKLGQITTSFRITSVTGNKIYLRNTGMNPLDTTKLGVYVDEERVNFQDAGKIGSGKVDKITISSALAGKHTLKVTAAVEEDSIRKDFGWVKVVDWNREDEGDPASEFWNNADWCSGMNRGSDVDEVWWSGDGCRALRYESEINALNSGKIRLTVHYYGHSMEASGVFFYAVAEDGTKHNIKCWDDTGGNSYCGPVSDNPYTCGRNGKYFTWEGTYTKDFGKKLDKFRLDTPMCDNGHGDRSHLYKLIVKVK